MRPDETRDEPGAGDATDLPEPETPAEAVEPTPPTEPTPPAEPPPFRGLEILNLDDVNDPYDGGDDDYDEDEDDEEEYDDDEDSVRTVLITGASGNIGRKLRDAWADAYDLVLIDREPDPDDREVIRADLSELDESWVTHFHGVDTVIHLAANASDTATWEELERPNLDALANVFHAAALAGVDRLIFASSNHAMGGYRELGDMPITVDIPPKPDGPYGATKLMGERLGRSLARAFDITFIALRLGWIQPGENRPDTLPDDWSRALWLSNNDLIRLFDCAVEAELDDRLFVVANGMSNNRGSRWDLGVTAELLGYCPEDDAYAEEI
jgi:NAD(P)-dependent dehydrogenase (short-subunit alcohol dehydrogenase family)